MKKLYYLYENRNLVNPLFSSNSFDATHTSVLPPIMKSSFVILLLLAAFFTLSHGGRGRKFRTVHDNRVPGGDGSCGPVPASACAVLYSDEFCGGRSHAVAINGPGGDDIYGRSRPVANNAPDDKETDVWLWRYDVESLSVAAGFTLLGHEFENGRGRGISISADNSNDHHVTDLEEYEHILDEDIRSLECRCDGGRSSRRVAAVGGHDCPPVPVRACAVVYAKENCKGKEQEVMVGNSEGYENMWLAWDEPESVSVSGGCTFTAFELKAGQGQSVAVVGGRDGKHVPDLEMFLNQHGVRSDVESFQCFCQ